MKTIQDVDFLVAGFAYGSQYGTLRKLLDQHDGLLMIQAVQDDGPNWKCRVYGAENEDCDFTFLENKSFEDCDKLSEFINQFDGKNITREFL